MAIKELLNMALPEIARRAQNELVITCPVDTGRLKNSIKIIPYGKGLLIKMVDYGALVEFGTPPHIIKPKDKDVLHWHKQKGRTQHSHPHSKGMGKDAFFSKEVKHPGTRPNPFVRTMINTKLRQIIIEELMRAQK